MHQLEQQSPSAAHWSDSQYEALFAFDAVPRITLVVADSIGTTLAGFLVARCLPDEWEVENVVVAMNSRRQGIGAALVRRLVQEGRLAGVCSIVLEVRESNRPAVGLYESIGFRQDGRRPDYYQAPLEDALLYRICLHSCDKIP